MFCVFVCTLLKTAGLAQRNYEDTRTSAVQEDVLEKELLEIQKVLLAMQVKVQMIIINSVVSLHLLLFIWCVRNHELSQWYDIVHSLSISSCDFAFDFPKMSRTNGDRVLNNSQQSSTRTKYTTVEPPLRPPSVELSNNLSLIETQLLLWSPRIKYTICSTLKSLLTTPSMLTTSLFDI